MNKIVLEHYPVSKLPEDLRVGLSDAGTVKIVIEEDARQSNTTASIDPELLYQKYLSSLKPLEAGETQSFRGSVTIDEAVARIRTLRDEWDDE